MHSATIFGQQGKYEKKTSLLRAPRYPSRSDETPLSLPGQFKDVHSPDKLSNHDFVSGTLKIFIPPIKKPRRKV